MSPLMMLSRELKRVPLDFDAPVGDTWAPLLEHPDWHNFPACETCGPPTLIAHGGERHPFGTDLEGRPKGDGLTPEARQLDRSWYARYIGDNAQRQALSWDDKLGQHEVDALIKAGRFNPVIDCPKGCKSPEDRGVERGQPWKTDCPDCQGRGWTRRQLEPGEITAADVNAQQRAGGFGHDGINHSIAMRARCELLGFGVNCETCDGHGDIATDELREKREAWEPPKPPEGPGFQLWQSISEGGPVSPVFASAEELAGWLAENYEVVGNRYDSDSWMKVLDGEASAFEVGSGQLV
jgi:hypothetical protein